MRFFPDNIWRLTAVVVSMLVANANINIVNAGGDPNVKDKKVEKSDSNIKQHNHNRWAEWCRQRNLSNITCQAIKMELSK